MGKVKVDKLQQLKNNIHTIDNFELKERYIALHSEKIALEYHYNIDELIKSKTYLLILEMLLVMKIEVLKRINNGNTEFLIKHGNVPFYMKIKKHKDHFYTTFDYRKSV